MTNGVKKTDKTKGEIRTIYADIRDFRWSHGLYGPKSQRQYHHAYLRKNTKMATQWVTSMVDFYAYCSGRYRAYVCVCYGGASDALWVT